MPKQSYNLQEYQTEMVQHLISAREKKINDEPWRKLPFSSPVIVYHANIQQTKGPPERGLKKGCWYKTWAAARYFLSNHSPFPETAIFVITFTIPPFDLPSVS